MDVLLKQAKIYSKGNPFNGKRVDLLIRNGKIVEIGRNIKSEGVRTVGSKNLCVSVGWLDIGTQIGEPGFEQREDFQSVIQAAAAGGYTAIASFPNTNPVVQSKSEVRFVKDSNSQSIVEFYPIGAVSKQCEGAEISEMIDMHSAGAVAFSDGRKSIQHAGLLLRALQYVKHFNGTIIQRAEDYSISRGGQIHEGLTSTQLGMQAIPSLSEEVNTQRDLELALYADSNFCLHQVSTGESLKILTQRKKQSDRITSTVSYKNLIHTDLDLANFNEQLKVKPPFREESDRKALINGIKKGTIDAISTNHEPQDEESKNKEFAYSTFGAIGLETCFSALRSFLGKDIPMATLITTLTTGPRKILQLENPEIAVGSSANLCLFDPDISWTYKSSDIQSKSRNSPYIDKEFTGKVIGVINRNKIQLNG